MSYVEEPNPKSHKCYRYPSGLLLGLLLLLLQSSPRRVFQHNIIPRIIATTTHNTSHLTSLKFNPLRAFLPLTSRPSTIGEMIKATVVGRRIFFITFDFDVNCNRLQLIRYLQHGLN